MIRLFWICLFVGLAIWLGLSMHQETGYVVIALKKTTIELPLWLGVLGLLVGFGLFYWFMRLVKWILYLPTSWRAWRQNLRKEKALSLTHQGFMDLAEQDWIKAERHLIKGVSDTAMPVLNYLGAAEAAQAQGAHKRRDKYLNLAANVEKNTIAVDLKAAEFEMAHGQYDDCLHRLNKLRNKVPHHPAVLDGLQRLYTLKQDWQALMSLLPTLKKYRANNGVDYAGLERRALQGVLLSASHAQTAAKLKATWEALPKAYRSDHYFVSIYVEGLVSYGEHELAEKVLRTSIKHHWHDDWVRWYGVLTHGEPNKALSTAEGWMKAHPESAILFLTLGRLAEQSELWGQAERYFEVSLSLMPTTESYAALGLLYERLGRAEQSQLCYRKGVLLAAEQDHSGEIPELQENPQPVVPSQVGTE